jgi:predicted nucleic acid-binding protein
MYLLDINVLVALFDAAHVHHEPAHRRFAASGKLATFDTRIPVAALVGATPDVVEIIPSD